MSDVKKVLTLVACGCICLMVATSASADFVGIKTVNKDDADTNALCTQAGGDFVADGLTVCNVFAIFDVATDRLLNIGDCDLQVFNGSDEDVFFQHQVGGIGTYDCIFLDLGFPDLICDSYVAIGNKCNGPNQPGGNDTTGTDPQFNCDPDIPDPDKCANNPLQLDWFGTEGHIFGGWFAGATDLQGKAGTWGEEAPFQILILQSSVLIGRNLTGVMSVFWQAEDGPTIAEVDIQTDCAAKCLPGPCDDNDACTGPGPDGGPCPSDEECDECTNGVCSGPPVECPSDGNACTDDVCDSGAGGCVNNPVPDGSDCDDDNPCTTGDECTGGQCGGVGCQTDSDCTDGDDCTTDVCDAGTGCCTNTPDCTTDADCGDGNDCTDDSCQGNCCVNTPNDDNCDDGNDCTDDVCGSGGCEFPPNSDSCNDGDMCTGPDTCSGGSCSGPDTECEPGASCNPDTGVCIFCETDADCDDGLNCNGAETCDPKTGCQDGTPIDCSGEDDQCNDGACVEPGDCVQEPANEGGDCDDGSMCTTGDACAGGDCVGEPTECPKGEVCNPSDGECVEVSDFLDIIPGKCPNQLRRNGLGFVKISLLGTDDLDANDVDISTLLLRNVTPFVEVPGEDPVICQGAVAPRSTPRPHVRDRGTPFEGELCGCHSSRKDGVADLDMKFKLAEIVNELCLANQPAGTEVRLELTGSTLNDQPIRAADCVILGRDLGPNP